MGHLARLCVCVCVFFLVACVWSVLVFRLSGTGLVFVFLLLVCLGATRTAVSEPTLCCKNAAIPTCNTTRNHAVLGVLGGVGGV